MTKMVKDKPDQNPECADKTGFTEGTDEPNKGSGPESGLDKPEECTKEETGLKCDEHMEQL